MSGTPTNMCFLAAFCRPGEVIGPLRDLLLDTALVLPCDLTEHEREEICELVALFTGLPVHIATRALALPAGHVCLLLEPIDDDPVIPDGSIVVAVRSSSPGRRRLDASQALRAMRDILLQTIVDRAPGAPLADIALWAEAVTDSPPMALRFAAAAHAANIRSTHLSDADLIVTGLAEVLGCLLRGVDPRVAEWVLARALPIQRPEQLVSTDAAILGEPAALQRALNAGLIEHLPEPGLDEVLDLRRPFAVLRQPDDLAAPLDWQALAVQLRPRVHPRVHALFARWLHLRPKPIDLPKPLPPPLFVGRTDMLVRLRALIEPGPEIRTTVVYGMAGVGKTALAARLCADLAGHTESLWLSLADGPEQAWKRLANALDPDAVLTRSSLSSPFTSNELVRSVKSSEREVPAETLTQAPDRGPAWLRDAHVRLAERDALIVVDDADSVDEAELARWLPRGPGRCVVLVLSTRAEHVLQRDNDAILVQLPPLDPQAARELLVGKVPTLADETSRGAADTLLKRLDGHPAALGWVSALLESTPLPEVEAAINAGPTDLRLLMHQAIDSLGPEERSVVDALAMTAPEGTYKNLLARLTDHEPEALESLLRRLADRALVELGDRTVRLHGIVQLVTESEMDPTRRHTLVEQHAKASDAVMLLAREQQDPDSQDILYPDVMLALARMSQRCSSSDEVAASLCYGLAVELLNYKGGSERSKQTVVEDGLNAALRVWTRETHPTEWARLQNSLSHFLYSRPFGDFKDDRRRAIEAFERALTVITEDSDPDRWAAIHANLGAVRLNTRGTAEELRQAIIRLKAADAVYIRTDPHAWGKCHTYLGEAIGELSRLTGEISPEQAITTLNESLAVCSPKEHNTLWAYIQYNLGTNYATLAIRNGSEFVELAIEAYRNALDIYTRDNEPKNWARTLLALGTTLLTRSAGERTANLRNAIHAFDDALSVLKDTSDAWMEAQHLLARALVALPVGDRRQNLLRAFECVQAVITVEHEPSKRAAVSVVLDELLNIAALVGNSPASIENILGSPDSQETIQLSGIGSADEYVYLGGRFEIVYIAQQADWITVNDLIDVPFSEMAVARFGLPPAPPSISNEHVLRWVDVYGLYAISLFPRGNGMSSYLDVKVFSV